MPPPKRPAAPPDERYEEGDILRADDPRPQRVAQYPLGQLRPRKPEEHIPTSIYNTEQAGDQELKPNYDPNITSDGGFKPAFLYVERGPGQGQLVQITQGSLIIGRAMVSDLRLQHPSVSRRHSQLTRVGEQFYLKDLGSQNGTYVNRQRLATEVEIFPGDELAIGNALIKLRGPLQATQAPAAVPAKKSAVVSAAKVKKASPTAIVRKARSPSSLRWMFFAGAVGFGLAAMLGIALWKFPARVSYRPMPEKVAAAQAPPEAAPADAPTNAREKQIQEAIAQKMNQQAVAKAADTKAEKVRVEVEAVPVPVPVDSEREKTAAADSKTAEKKKSADPFDDAPGAFRRAVDGAKETSKEPAKDTAKKAGVPSPYLMGDVEAALTEAKSAGDDAVVKKLEKFSTAYEAAKAAVVANNGTLAIKSFETALKVDEGLSGGKGKYAAEIHNQLSSLYSLVGFHYVSSQETENAKAAFKASLKHNPNNEKAAAQLATLEAAPKATATAEAAEDSKAKAPLAPLRRPGVKPNDAASKKQAIDDAFGD